MDLSSLLSDAPRGAAALALADLIAARHERARAVDAVDARQRNASEAVAQRSDELAALEARDDATDAQRKTAESVLLKARAASSEPWSERLAGARRAVVSADSAVSAFVANNYGSLSEEIGEDAAQAAADVDDALAALVGAYERREHVAARSIALASVVGRVKPGAVARSRAEQVVRAASALLDSGGESAPVPPAQPVPEEAVA